MMNTRNWIKFICLSLIWGTSFLWIRIVVKDVGPFILVFFRVLFAILTIAVYLLATRTKIQLTWRKLGIFAFLGFFNVTLPFLLISWAELTVSSGLASVMNSTYPLFALLFSVLFLPEERVTWFRSIGLFIGFCGVVILASTGFTSNSGSANWLGIAALSLASICYAVSTVFARITTRGMKPGEQSAGQIGMALVFIAIATVIFEPHLRLPSVPISWIGLIWLGVLCSAIATITWFSLMNSVGTTRTSLVSYVFPVIAVMLGIVILGEEFVWQLAVGGILVIFGVIWVNYFREWKKKEKR
jgi:drug/metabolite transporter (DMT)-like permease